MVAWIMPALALPLAVTVINRVRCGIAEAADAKGAVLLFHRGYEHGERMAHVVDGLNLPDHHFFAWDAQGHGRSPARRGHAPSPAPNARDLETFTHHVATPHAVAREDMAVIA